MTDRPILFSGPMVRALLDGSKTQTRRLLNPQPYPTANVTGFQKVFKDRPYFEATGENGPISCAFPQGGCFCVPYPNIKIATGDRLWVREAWKVDRALDTMKPRDIRSGVYVAYDAGGASHQIKPKLWIGGRLRPSIFMPRWASRLTLTVTDVRIQRLQNISEGDARDEGCKAIGSHNGPDEDERSYVWTFQTLWDSLNAERAPWEANPWVVAYSFTVAKHNIDQK